MLAGSMALLFRTISFWVFVLAQASIFKVAGRQARTSTKDDCPKRSHVTTSKPFTAGDASGCRAPALLSWRKRREIGIFSVVLYRLRAGVSYSDSRCPACARDSARHIFGIISALRAGAVPRASSAARSRRGKAHALLFGLVLLQPGSRSRFFRRVCRRPHALIFDGAYDFAELDHLSGIVFAFLARLLVRILRSRRTARRAGRLARPAVSSRIAHRRIVGGVSLWLLAGSGIVCAASTHWTETSRECCSAYLGCR